MAIIILELVAFAVAMVFIVPAIAWRIGYFDDWFTTCETENIVFVDVGETNVFTYLNSPGRVLRDGVEVNGIMCNGVIVEGDSEAEKTLFQKWFGLYWVGFKFMGRKVHTFPLTKERVNQRLTPAMGPADWVEIETPITVTQLRRRFPRPVLVLNVKFLDRFGDNILVLANYEVLIPKIPIYTLKARFFEILADYVKSGMINYCQCLTQERFIGADKLDGGDMSNQIITAINRKIEHEVGIKLTGLTIAVYQPTNTAEEEALEAEKVATLQGQATVATAKAGAKSLVISAQAAAKKTVIDATALAKADVILGKASVADVIALTDAFILVHANPDLAVQSATALGRAKRFSNEDSPVVTLVDGSANVALPIPERRVTER